MRTNLPVTQREIPLGEGDLLISRTDLKGVITYANPGFIRISGFAEHELLGQAHNLVRHPDMPKEAFKDLWDTIQTGRSWSGIVKNRAKSGDYYWVKADVTPLREGSRVVGYTSVRGRATREEIQGADALYAALRAGQATLAPSRFKGLLTLQVRGMMLAGLNILGLLGTQFLENPTARMAFLITGIASGMGLAWTLKSLVVNQLSELRVAFRRADLQIQLPVTRQDEVGELTQGFNILNLRFRRIVHELGRIAHEVSAESRDIASGNLDLSNRTERQASNLEETASCVEEIRAMVVQTADNTQVAKTRTVEAQHRAEASVLAMGELVTAMNALQGQTVRIQEVVGLVDELAFQTNLLALNAAVEAARAGEQGRGFAVVAAEVRSLAQRSAEAAKEIRGLLQATAQQSSAGVVLAQGTGAAIKDLALEVRGVAEQVEGIAEATTSQRQGIQEIHRAINELDSVTQQNAALVEQAAAASSNLEHQARDLADLAACFIPRR